MRNTFLLTLLLFVFYNNTFADNQVKPPIISFKDAINNNMVKCAISGSYAPGIYFRLNQDDGLHFGKCMEFVFKNLMDSFYLIKLDVGSALLPFDSTFQTMYITKTVELPIYPKEEIAFNLNAMCGQIHDGAPYKGIPYNLSGQADGDVLKTVKIIEQEYLQNHIGQYLLWAVANQASSKELREYGADSMDMKKVESLLIANNLRNKVVVPKVKVKPKKKQSVKSKPTFKTISNTVYYTYLTYTMILTAFGVAYVLRKVYKKRKKVKLTT